MAIDFPTLTTFAIYLTAMLAVGFWVYSRTTSVSEFTIGGRSLNSWVAALSAQASDFSAWLFLGLPGAVYMGGVAGAGWIAIGLVVGSYLSWRFIAARLRLYTARAGSSKRAEGSVTISSFFANRFEDRSHFLRIVSALAIVIFFAFYIASGLVAAGVLFNELFGLDVGIAITLAVGVIVGYTVLGGFNAVSFTDVFQGSLMWFAVIAVPAYAIFEFGGIGAFIGGLTSAHPELLSITSEVTLDAGDSWTNNGSLGLVGIVSALAWGLGYFGQPHILVRYMAIQSVAAIPNARRLAVTWSITGLTAATCIGLTSIVYFGNSVSEPDGVYIQLIQESLNPWAGGIMLAAILAAIMSTADSQLMAASSALSEDFYRVIIDKNAPPERLLWAGRLTVAGVALAAYVLAFNGGSLPDLVGYAWAGFGATFGPIIVLSLLWRRMNRTGAAAGMITGTLTVLAWGHFDPFGWGLYEMIPGFLANVVCIFLFNPLGTAPSRKMQSDFDSVDQCLQNGEMDADRLRERLSGSGNRSRQIQPRPCLSRPVGHFGSSPAQGDD